MSNEPTYLILGASKNVGSHLFRRLGPAKAVATYCSHPVPRGVHFDALSMDVGPLLDRYPTITSAAILYGETDPDKCYGNPQWSRALNVGSITRVIDELDRRGIHILFMSSQFVFDGVKGDYTEEDPPNPILLYGEQKLAIERYLEQNSESRVVLRLSKAVGDRPKDGSLFSNWIDAILAGSPAIRCATDQKLSPIIIADVVEGIVSAMDRKLQGVFHLSGPRGYRRMELLEMLLLDLKKRVDLQVKVEPCSILDFDLPERRPVDVSMRSDKLVSSTGLEITDMETVCRRVVRGYFSQAAQRQEAEGGHLTDNFV